MRKGKGAEPSFRPRCRGVAVRRPVLTRLTRTMGFVELPHSPCASGSIGASDEEELLFEDPSQGVH